MQFFPLYFIFMVKVAVAQFCLFYLKLLLYKFCMIQADFIFPDFYLSKEKYS